MISRIHVLLLGILLPLMASGAAIAQYRLTPAFPNLPFFSNPIEMVHAGDGTNRLFVAQQRGLVYVFQNNPAVNQRKTFMNLASKVSQSGSETGLLGLAFHPNYENNRYLYTYFTFDSASVLWSRVSRFQSSSSNPDTVLLNTELIYLTFQQPFSNHNGGKIAFGPDGYLYLSFGDGGSGGDPGNRAQNRSLIFGKIIRIDVDVPGVGIPYSIPPTNPYYQNTQGFREEIFAYGLRNTWKFSFDALTGTIWAGDVGQTAREEIDIIENGKNYGWNKMEGFLCYGTCDTTGRGFTRPVYDYPRTVGTSITGGYVYRGALHPGLYGKYIYADYSFGTVWSLSYDSVNPPVNALMQDTNFAISSFGEDEQKELYLMRYSTSGSIFKFINTGAITLDLKLAPEGFYDSGTGRLALRDTFKVYLHQSFAPYQVVDSAVTVIDSVTLSGYCLFSSAPNGTYYIRVSHRNALDTWSKSGGQALVRGPLQSYDFTTSANQAFGSNQVQKGSLFCFFSGDVNDDDIVDLPDLLFIDNDVSGFVSGYIDTDLNGDGTADIADLLIADNNVQSVVSVIAP